MTVIKAILKKTNTDILIFYSEGVFSGFWCANYDPFPIDVFQEIIKDIVPPCSENIGDYCIKMQNKVEYKLVDTDTNNGRSYELFNHLKSLQ